MIFQTYVVQKGDTLEKVSRYLYGYEGKAYDIATLNGVNDPLTVGAVLKYEQEENSLCDKTEIDTTSDIKTFNLIIDNEPITNISGYRLKEGLTSVKQLNIYLPVSSKTLKMTYGKSVYLCENGERVFTGFIKQSPQEITGQKHIVELVCKSKAGLLIDSCFPLSAYPLEFNNLSLRQIIRRACDIKGIRVSFQEGNDLILDSVFNNDIGNGVSAEVDESIYSFLVRITKSKGLIISDDPFGGLFIFRAIEKEIRIEINRNTKGFVGISRHDTLDNLAEEYIVLSQYKENNAIGKARIEDFPLPITKTIILENNTIDDINSVARWICCRQIGSNLKYIIDLTVNSINNNKLSIGEYLKLEYNGNVKDLIIESKDTMVADGQQVKIVATLINAYSGVIPNAKELYETL